MRELSRTSLPEMSFSPLRHFEYPMCLCVVLIYCNLFIYMCFVFDVRDVKAYENGEIVHFKVIQAEVIPGTLCSHKFRPLCSCLF